MKKRRDVRIPVGDVLDALASLKKARALTRSRGVRRELSTVSKRLSAGSRDNVSVSLPSLLKALRAFAGLVTWGKDVALLVHALMAKN